MAWYNSPQTPSIGRIVATPVLDTGDLGSTIASVVKRKQIADIIRGTKRGEGESDASYQARVGDATGTLVQGQGSGENSPEMNAANSAVFPSMNLRPDQIYDPSKVRSKGALQSILNAHMNPSQDRQELADKGFSIPDMGANALTSGIQPMQPESNEAFAGRKASIASLVAPQSQSEPLSKYYGRMSNSLALIDPQSSEEYKNNALMNKAMEDWDAMHPGSNTATSLGGKGNSVLGMDMKLGSEMMEKGAQTQLSQQGRMKDYLLSDVENAKQRLEQLKLNDPNNIEAISAQINEVNRATNAAQQWLSNTTGNPSNQGAIQSQGTVNNSELSDSKGNLITPTNAEYQSWSQPKRDLYDKMFHQKVSRDTANADIAQKKAGSSVSVLDAKIAQRQAESKSADEYFSAEGSPYKIPAMKYKTALELKPAFANLNNPDPNVRAQNRAIAKKGIDALTSAAEGGSVGEREELNKTGFFTRMKNLSQSILGNDYISNDQANAFRSLYNEQVTNINKQVNEAKKTRQFSKISYQPLNYLSNSESNGTSNGGSL
jgi:hypothetical protein